MTYVVQNIEDRYHRAMEDRMADHRAPVDDGEVVVAGNPLTAHAYKGRHPDADVTAVDRDYQTVLLQSFIGHELAQRSDPEDIRRYTFLSPFFDELPDDWDYDRGFDTVTVPEDDFLDIRDRYKAFMTESPHFSTDDWLWDEPYQHEDEGRYEAWSELFDHGARDGSGYYGSIDDDDSEVTVSLRELRRQPDIYPEVIDELAEQDVRPRIPDDIVVADIRDMDRSADIIFTGNIIDHPLDPRRSEQANDTAFLEAVDELGGDEYVVELYSVGMERRRFGTTERRDARTAADIDRAAAGVDGRRYEQLDTDGIRGRIHHMDFDETLDTGKRQYLTTEEDAPGNVFLLRVEPG